MEKYSTEIKKEWNDNPKYWKGYRLFYFNKEDQRLFPPKRSGTGYGWTVNFSNPKSILALAALTAVLIGIIELISRIF